MGRSPLPGASRRAHPGRRHPPRRTSSGVLGAALVAAATASPASWFTVLRESWAQLCLVKWPETAVAVRVAALLLATVVLVMLLVGLADAALSSR